MRRGGRGGNKFGARRTVGVEGRLFDSKLESDRASDLALLAAGGEISALAMQPRVQLEPGIFYRADFSYEENGQLYFEDTKGVVTERFRLICKLWKLHGPAPLRIVRRYGKGGFVIDKTIVPHGAANG